MSTVEEHYAQAEQLLTVAAQAIGSEHHDATVAAAQVHATLATAYPAAVRAAEPPAPDALTGYFVAPDAHDEEYVWQDHERRPLAMIRRRGMPDDLWAHITRGLEVRP